MILAVTDPRLARWIATAIRDRAAVWQRNGLAVPPDVLELADLLLPEGSSRPSRVRDEAVRRRTLAQARSSRYRARQRGEDVPLRRPGPPVNRDEVA